MAMALTYRQFITDLLGHVLYGLISLQRPYSYYHYSLIPIHIVY